MIIGIGVDTVEIDRFCSWVHFSPKQLLKIFSQHELDYAFSNSKKTAERLAVRFAAKEAFYKAFSSFQPTNTVPFLTLCKYVQVQRNNTIHLQVDWQSLQQENFRSIKVHLSLTHSNNFATALVIMERVPV